MKNESSPQRDLQDLATPPVLSVDQSLHTDPISTDGSSKTRNILDQIKLDAVEQRTREQRAQEARVKEAWSRVHTSSIIAS